MSSVSLFDKYYAAMCESKSLYIPLMPKDLVMVGGDPLYTEDSLRHFFEHILQLAPVTRVDYITKSTRVDPSAIGIFIHFEYWRRGPTFDRVISQINDQGDATMFGYWDYESGSEQQFTSSFNRKPRFFKYKINRSPIPMVSTPPANLSQIVHDNETMRILLQEKDTRIAELEAEIARLTNNLTYVPNEAPMTLDELL